MAVSHPMAVVADWREEQVQTRYQKLRRRIRNDTREIVDLFKKVHFFTHEFDRQAIGMVFIGLILVAWDI